MVTQSQFDFKQQVMLFWQKKWYFIIPFLLVCVLFLIGSYRLNKVYKSATTILIGDERAFSRSEQYLIAEGGLQRIERIAKIKGMILSYDYLKELILKLELEQDNDIRNQALSTYHNMAGLNDTEIVERWLLDHLRHNIHVESQRTEFITIAVENNKPERAYLIAKTIAEIFIEKSHSNQMQGLEGTLDFAKERLDYYQNKVEESEKKLQNYRLGLAQEQAGISRDDRIKKINQLMQATTIKISELERTISTDEQNLSSLYRNVQIPESAETETYRSTISDIAAQTLTIVIDSDLQDIRIMRLNEKLNMARIQLLQEYEHILRRNLDGISDTMIARLAEKKLAEFELDLMKNRIVALTRMSETVLVKAERASEKEAIISILAQEVEMNRQMYNMCLQRVRNLQTETAFQQSEGALSYKIIEPAYLPMYPEKPNKPLLMIVGAFLGMLIGTGLLLTMIFLDHSFYMIDEVESYLQIPILGTIPQLPISDERPVWKRYTSLRNLLLGIGGIIFFVILIFSDLFWKLFLGFLNKIG